MVLKTKKSREILDYYRVKSSMEQEENRAEIVEAFRKFLEIAEDANEFAKHTDGITFWPEMIWNIANCKVRR